KRYRRPRTSRPRTPPATVAHSREPATPRPYCRAVGLQSLRLGTADECVLLIGTSTTSPNSPQRIRPLSNRGDALRVPDYPDGSLGTPSYLNSRTKLAAIVLKHNVPGYS